MYSILNKKNYKLNNLEFQPFSEIYIEEIRKIRNKQKKILRQNKTISKSEQKKYFKEVIRKDFSSKKPKNILMLIFKGKKLIGYCGLANIDWFNKRAELSFILKSKYNSKKNFSKVFQISLDFLETLIFEELRFKKLCSETFCFRNEVISILLNNNFFVEGQLKNHICKNGKYYDTFILAKEKFKYKIDKCNLLITSSSNKTTLVDLAKNSLRRVIKKFKVYCTDQDNEVVTRFTNKNFIKLPKLEKKNLQSIYNKLNKHNINFVLPTRSSELIFWSENKKFFEKKAIRIIASNLKSIKLCLDKYTFYKILKRNNILTPETLLGQHDSKNFIIKPRFGAGGKEIAELKKIKPNYISQKYINGKEISVDCWISRNKKISKILMRERIKIRNGESEISKFFFNKNIYNNTLSVIKLLNLSGIINVQGFLKNKKFYIFDCNPRVGGGMNFSYLSGLDILNWSIIEKVLGVTAIKDLNFGKNKKKFFRIKKDFSTDDICF